MKDIAKSTTEILNILPTKRCISPRRILNILRKKEQPGMYCIIAIACVLLIDTISDNRSIGLYVGQYQFQSSFFSASVPISTQI